LKIFLNIIPEGVGEIELVSIAYPE